MKSTDLNPNWKSALAELVHNYGAQIGKVAISWNAAHVRLGEVFVYLVTPSNRKMGLGVWNSMLSDSAQRDALRGAVTAGLDHDKALLAELTWGLNQFDNLRGRRNSIIHAPYGIIVDEPAFTMFPDATTGNKGAMRLKGRDFSEECRVLISASDALSRFFTQLIDHLHTGRRAPATRTLPERPSMPLTWQQQDNLATQAQAKQKRREKPSHG